MKTARRLKEIEPFRVMALLARANELALAGNEVIHLEVGEPDFETPDPIVDQARTALSQGIIRYTDARGILELRQAISEFYLRSLGTPVDTDRIFVTAGASGGLLLLSALLLDPGDKLLMTDPGYPCNRHFVASFNAEGLLVPVSADTNYQLSPELIEQYWTSDTRGVLVASPANPTGAVLKADELSAVSETVHRLGGVLIVDEIYQGLTYEPGVTSVLEIDPDAFVVNSFSKYFGMTGWRLGWSVIPSSLSVDMEKLAQNLFICPSTIAQYAALAAFSDESLAIMEARKVEFLRRRDFLVPALKSLGFEIANQPAGAFYIYARLPAHMPDAERFCHELLEEHFVAVTPGTDFGFNEASRHVRFSYATDIDQLRTAVERLAVMVNQ